MAVNKMLYVCTEKMRWWAPLDLGLQRDWEGAVPKDRMCA